MLATAFACLQFGVATAADQVGTHPSIDAFLASIANNETLAESDRDTIAKIVRHMSADPYTHDVAITEGLRELYPEYSSVLSSLGEENLEVALPELTRFSTDEDPFLKADATFFLARAEILREHYEKALPPLVSVTGPLANDTPHAGQALFLRGIVESGLLMRSESIKSLERFLRENPNAPERMRFGAIRHIEVLRQIQEGSLFDVQDQMDFSRRRLDLAYSGDQTQDTQDNIVEMLSKLIEQAEQQEGGT